MENFSKTPWGLLAGILLVIIVSYNLGKSSGSRKSDNKPKIGAEKKAETEKNIESEPIPKTKAKQSSNKES